MANTPRVSVSAVSKSLYLLRSRLQSMEFLFNRALLYALLTVLSAGGYALLVAGASLISGEALRVTDPYLVGGMVFLLALLLNPVRLRVQQAVDTVFFRQQTLYRERLETFVHELTQVVELSDILHLLRRYVRQDLAPAQFHIFLHDAQRDQYIAMASESGEDATDLQFPPNSALVQYLARHHKAISLTDGRTSVPTLLRAEQARLAVLGCHVFVPLPGQQQLTGWLALGPRCSDEPYTQRDLTFLASLGDQAALAVERAQVVADLERRVREMNVLTRIAQGINFTINFDDLLELIYAQVSQVIPACDCRVALYSKETNLLTYAFFLENDERVGERENQFLSAGYSLDAQVGTSQRAIITDDYERESRIRGFLPDTTGLYAWLGVPLMAGTETIGVLSLGSRDPAIVYTPEQSSLLQAIADQVAGAIVKAQLIRETERRARQLATLNEIGRSLTSTLELRPLLNRILKSATEILNCTAGSLFLVDEETGDLVFEVVIGPVASDLVGQRLPQGKGLVGEAVTTGLPVIANDVKRRKEWFGKTDVQTGFDTQDLLVVPMRVQDRVIGVIEVINKLDGAPFNQSDQELLATFSSQATVAIENARLYTMTDQALAARVEELSIMQRIDRELNASLDVDRAISITLEWALRQSGAQAGFVGFVEPDGIRVVSSQGYQMELEPFADPAQFDTPSMAAQSHIYRLPPELPGLGRVLETRQLQFFNADSQDDRPSGLLCGAKSQVMLPIRLTEAAGILVLESTRAEVCTEDVLAFLSRLCDHAAIAISNARLYREIEENNRAKSKFVSFVAHELKNPMASIKGYTELVAGGMAGPVNEMQSSFLATVRSNVDRMNTIVSDLNDLTKIEVGSLRLEYKAVKVKDVLDEVIRSLNRQIEEKAQALRVELPEDLPMVWVDQFRLGQVMTNLVSNAIKYTLPSGEICIGGERCTREEIPGGMEVIHIWVKDNGIGIAEEDQAKIFQQYFRTDISKETASGTGLGLNISKSLIEMQGGRIWFESKLGMGTTFHVVVPMAEAE